MITLDNLFEASLLDYAEDVALDVHHRQKRRHGGEYIVHPKRVSLVAKTLGFSRKVQIIALLHDTIEDSHHSHKVRHMILSKFGPDILQSVENLSHDKSVDYTSYLYDLYFKDNDAFKVKMVDMFDNLTDNPTEKQFNKYKNAISYLLKHRAIVSDRIKGLLKL